MQVAGFFTDIADFFVHAITLGQHVVTWPTFLALRVMPVFTESGCSGTLGG
jgi:hypothetical protein